MTLQTEKDHSFETHRGERERERERDPITTKPKNKTWVLYLKGSVVWNLGKMGLFSGIFLGMALGIALMAAWQRMMTYRSAKRIAKVGPSL
ncbi:Extended synaptotagmin-3 [Spatholobus suberectus]|nr:Extended synaptotagmin-3 [Spatholobus suberectus]